MTELLIAIAVWCGQPAGTTSIIWRSTKEVESCRENLEKCLADAIKSRDATLTEKQMQCFINQKL